MFYKKTINQKRKQKQKIKDKKFNNKKLQAQKKREYPFLCVFRRFKTLLRTHNINYLKLII